MTDQTILALTIGILIGLLIWGKWRYDAVTLVCLAGLVLFGVVPAENAFSFLALDTQPSLRSPWSF